MKNDSTASSSKAPPDAAWLAQTGDFANAEEIVRDIRARFDGEKRNPFDEPECGRHYARALASWSVFKAVVKGRVKSSHDRARLAPHKGRAFLVDHPAWSHFAEEYGLRQLAIKAELSTTHAGP